MGTKFYIGLSPALYLQCIDVNDNKDNKTKLNKASI